MVLRSVRCMLTVAPRKTQRQTVEVGCGRLLFLEANGMESVVMLAMKS